MITMNISERLKNIQISLGVKDEVFAQRLGITVWAWRKIKTAGVRPGHKTYPAIMKAFPELKHD